MGQVNLRLFDGSDFNKGAGFLKQTLWYFINALFVRPSWNPFMGVKIGLLRLFGAKIGKRICLKPCVLIKSPWNLVIGDDCWIGEKVWIDNLDKVYIGSNVCISQGALVFSGNHDYTQVNFPYRNAPIVIEDGAWVGAKAVVAPGVTIRSHSILSLGAVCTKDTEPFGIYQGNPAVKIKTREIR